jgi:hypothetical protein
MESCVFKTCNYTRDFSSNKALSHNAQHLLPNMHLIKMEAAIAEYSSKILLLVSNRSERTATLFLNFFFFFCENGNEKGLYLGAGRCSAIFHFWQVEGAIHVMWLAAYDTRTVARRHDWALGEELFGGRET